MNAVEELERVQAVGDSLLFLFDASLYLAARSRGCEPAPESGLQVPESVADVEASVGRRRGCRALSEPWKLRALEPWAVSLVRDVSEVLAQWECARGVLETAAAYGRSEGAILDGGDKAKRYALPVMREICRLDTMRRLPLKWRFSPPCQPGGDDDWAKWCRDLARLKSRVIETVLVDATNFLATKAAASAASASAGRPRKREAPDGEWSLPMSLNEFASRLGNMGRDKCKRFLETSGLRRLGRQQWQVRLDRMDKRTRALIETGRPPRT
ncbi:MAG: hypothetical protein FJ290_20715 [Planctomycetes bacterium]|nr:hypothetical protein [Planctomycetota bacterium]